MYNLALLDPEHGRVDLSKWRIGGFGGAPMPEETIKRLAAALPQLTLLNVYGSTETTGPVTMMPPGQIAAHRDTVGRALTGAEIVVMDADGREVPAGEEGELWIRGPMVVPGYWDNPTADASAFLDGYWRSGDVGSIDAAGHVRILDRHKDVINRGGYKIYSIEVENVLMQHSGVIEAAVVPAADPVLGQIVHAIVVTARHDLDWDELRRHCAAHLSDYKVPTKLTIRTEPLPRNANGKVLKTALLPQP
jgi:acyl-CoA synthetase (AMP-forming)/AMP-acid ligase II